MNWFGLDDASSFALVLTRVGGMMMTAPLLGSQAVPPLVRVGRDLPAQVHDPSHQRFSFRTAPAITSFWISLVPS